MYYAHAKMNTVLALLLPIAAPIAAVWWVYFDATKHGYDLPIHWVAIIGIAFVGGFLLTDISNSVFISKHIISANIGLVDQKTRMTAMTMNTLVELLSGTTAFVLYLYWKNRGVFA